MPGSASTVSVNIILRIRFSLRFRVKIVYRIGLQCQVFVQGQGQGSGSRSRMGLVSVLASSINVKIMAQFGVRVCGQGQESDQRMGQCVGSGKG